MSHDQPHDPRGGRDGVQPLERIQHSRADGRKQEGKPKRAAVVADPRNRLADGAVDPATGEVRPARE